MKIWLKGGTSTFFLNQAHALSGLLAKVSFFFFLLLVYSPEDVQLAIEHGIDGVLISNHGGRQLDSVPATLDSLRACVEVGRGRIAIGLDGGIRRGSDIFKALALGADFCFVGRIPVWGLAVRI